MTVAVVGATGTIGPHIVNSLLARDAEVRVITRDGGRAAAVLPGGVELRETDLTDHKALLEATRGADSLLLLTSHAQDMTDLQLRIIRTLRRTGIRIVKISGTSSAINPDGPYTCRQHWEVEQVLAASGQPYVVLRPNGFMQRLIGQILLPAVRATGTVPNPLAGSGLSLIDGRDVGDCAAAVLTSTDWDGQTLVLTGPRAVSSPELARIIGELAGRPVEVKEITPADIRAGLNAKGTPEWEAEHFEEMYEMFRRGESEFVTDDVARITGHAPRTVEAYLSEISTEITLPQNPTSLAATT